MPRPVQPTAQAAPAQDARSDLNGDGEADLVVAGDEYRPRYNVPTWTLTVVYGSSKGLSRRANELWRETDFASGKPTRGQITGLATGDFDGDGFDDVAVGTDVLDESEDLSKERIGEVRILFGSRTGVASSRSQVLGPQTDDGRLPVVDDDPSFGMVLAVADLGRGTQDDLAIGSPWAASGAGQVTVVYGSRAGLSWAGRQVWTQDVIGVPGSSAHVTPSDRPWWQPTSATGLTPIWQSVCRGTVRPRGARRGQRPVRILDRRDGCGGSGVESGKSGSEGQGYG